MPGTLLTACGLVLLACVTVLPQTTDRERDGLKGLVKTVRVREGTVVIENGKRTDNPLTLISEVSYDESGYRTKLDLYDIDGTIKRRISYEYDSQTRQLTNLITYNSQNVMLRKISDKYGTNGRKVKRTILDYNEDGTLFRRTELTLGSMNELLDVAEFDGEGKVVKKNSPPIEEPGSESVASLKSLSESKDRPISMTTGGGTYLDIDAHGNWTRGQTRVTARTYESGASTRREEWTYREFTYY